MICKQLIVEESIEIPVVTNLVFNPTIIDDMTNWSATVTVENTNISSYDKTKIILYYSNTPNTPFYTSNIFVVQGNSGIDVETSTFSPLVMGTYEICAKVI